MKIKNLLVKVASGTITAKQLIEESTPIQWGLKIILAEKQEDTVFTVTNNKGESETFTNAQWLEKQHHYKPKIGEPNTIELIDGLDS
ncbi:hypothetical protein QNI19_26725 [Cytophagaceae bacterium DM2B3-1]|uniref:Phage protein n=1 Tax=Xanthocytophaga flava TaxID=3048013 RepID=A0ABT7CS86_9BACT|nr:hypothetical protein [Xanthocytophaga flavus]MDJ1496556.1 hypothetical protein [Xanthocytophaga flavus]